MCRCDYFEGTSGFKNLKNRFEAFRAVEVAQRVDRVVSVLISQIKMKFVSIRWPREITNILLSIRVPSYSNPLLLRISIFVLFASNCSFLLLFFNIKFISLNENLTEKGNSSPNLIHFVFVLLWSIIRNKSKKLVFEST